MLTSLELRNYRRFTRLRLQGLQRVNLLVGENNVGKSSILEAISILAQGTIPYSLMQIMRRRNERFPPLDGEDQIVEMDVAHFFHGHTSAVGSWFSILGETVDKFGLRISITEHDPKKSGVYSEAYPLLPEWDEGPVSNSRALRLEGYQNDLSATIALSQRGGLSFEAMRQAALTATNLASIPVVFVPVDGLSVQTLARLWENLISGSNQEETAIEALRIIEPSLQDLRYSPGNAGFLAGLEKLTSRVPFGSLGGGMKQLLALALAIQRPRGGYLLIDEIDTGLHYTTFPKIWRLIVETAQRLNVQVFATTHSDDCVRSLAALQEETPELAKEVALHRIEKGFQESIPFTVEELAIGTRRQMEFR